MKKTYTAPEMEISTFDVEDVITLSGQEDYSEAEDYDLLYPSVN